MDLLQFYPTPPALAEHMVNMFTDKITSRSIVLEPHAGKANLVDAIHNRKTKWRDQEFQAGSPKVIDVIEIDQEHVTFLRARKDVSIVGYDFLEFSSKKMYSHIILNPPYKNGAAHLLKAWDILTNGEIVALVNAETIRNVNSDVRRRLQNIIATNEGTVEFREAEFLTTDAIRKSAVEVAVIHLKKCTSFKDIYIDDLKPDLGRAPKFDNVQSNTSQLVIPESTIDQAVTIFNAAVKCLQDEITICAQLRNNSCYYSGLLSDSLIRSEQEIRSNEIKRISIDEVTTDYNERYQDLKEKAWSLILGASNLTRGLSSNIIKTIHSDFKEISALDFTRSNIHGFLANLVMAKQSGNIGMLCDAFDQFTANTTENRAYYRGWKSNDKHKRNAYKLKTTRFITTVETIGNSLRWSDRNKLNDVDLAFATLDGQLREKTTGITDLLNSEENFTRLRCGERLEATYFDIRYYQGVGSVHVFPRNKKLIDRLNRIVGKQRQWLPDIDERVSKEFWLQFEGAEKLQKSLDKNKEYKRMTRWQELHDESSQSKLESLIVQAGNDSGFDMDCLLCADQEKRQDISPVVKELTKS